MNFLSNQQKGALYAISSGLCYGLIGYFGVTLMNAGLSVFNMLFWRFLIASFFMLIILLPKWQMIFQNYRENAKVIFCGMAFYSTSSAFYFMASKYTGTGLAMVIFFTYPAMVMLFNIFYLKTQMSAIYYLACSLVITGMVCLGDMHELAFDVFGIGLGLISALFYACYILASKKVTISPAISTFMILMGGMMTCFIASLSDSGFYIPNDLDIWYEIGCLAIICTALPIVLLFQALKYISSEKASMLSVLEPIFVVIFGIILLDEKISNLQIMGTVIILSGALITLLPIQIRLKPTFHQNH